MRDKAPEIFVERRYRTSHHNSTLGTPKKILARNAENESGGRKDEKNEEKEGGRKKDRKKERKKERRSKEGKPLFYQEPCTKTPYVLPHSTLHAGKY